MNDSVLPWLHNLQTSYEESILPWDSHLQAACEELQMGLANACVDINELQNIARRVDDSISKVAGKTERLYFDRYGDLDIDYLDFENQFRGSMEDIKERFRVYLPYFSGCSNVLDLGCGRGEMLSLLRDNGIVGKGIDLCPEMVDFCRGQGLDVELNDALDYLAAQPDDTFDGIFIGQVVEHLGTRTFLRLTDLCLAKLKKDAVMVYETLNPENLEFLKWFYMDFTHVYPIHPVSAAYILRQKGWRQVERIETTHSDVDYAILARK